MPIKAENKSRYPKNWKQISERIRFRRANSQCECTGECGYPHEGRCSAVNHFLHPVTGSYVVLTVAHLDHTPENCDDENLKAMCQRCHLAYDIHLHRQNRLDNLRCKQTLDLLAVEA